MFQKNKLYKRKKLHEKFGGREQYGISNCPKHPIIFIFSNPKEKQDVYEDRWEGSVFYYSGEGRIGDMKFSGGNKSILNHKLNNKKIYLFEGGTGQSGYWKYIDELKLVNWRHYPCKDDNGQDRKGIQFKLLSVSKDYDESVLIIEQDHKYESKEGRITFTKHKKRERDGNLPKEKKRIVLEREGGLSCEVCNFNFTQVYGERGRDYIECHHNIPVSELKEGDTTKLSDLSLLCSNCHRMIHRKKPWLTTKELKKMMNSVKTEEGSF